MDRDNITDYYTYLRTYSQELGSRIVEIHPPVQRPNDPVAKQGCDLIAQAAARAGITGLAKHLKTHAWSFQ